MVSIDDKQVCGSYDKHIGKGAIHLVSAIASTNGLVLGQVNTSDKSNEIKAIAEKIVGRGQTMCWPSRQTSRSCMKR